MSKIALYESTTPPTPPTGFLYLFARAGRLFTKSAAGAETPAFTPAGVVNAFAGAAAPSGWLLCDGSAVSRTAYPDLFMALGTTYGAGDGATTFNLPDLRDRSPVGSSPTKSLASKAGSATVSLSSANIPPTITQSQFQSGPRPDQATCQTLESATFLDSNWTILALAFL